MQHSSIPTLLNAKVVFALVPIALLLSACGGGGSGYSDGNTPNQVSPILQVGMQRQYTGTATRSVVYANPSSTSVNNTLAYSFTEMQNVLQAPNNALGKFDIRTVTTYTITQDPGTGTVPLTQTVDDYRNLITYGATQATVDLGQTTTTLGIDETANALGGGPYTQTTSTTTTFPTQRTSLYYPLQAGASLMVPQSSTQNITFSDVNPGGSAPPNGSNIGYSKVRVQQDDGSFSFQQTGATGVLETLVQNPDGSGSNTVTSAASTTATTLGLPVAVNGTSTLPINRVITSTTPSNKTFSAANWYPNAGQVSSPLILQKQTVVGPVTSLPAQCNGALLQPNMFEIDTNTSNLNTISASLSVTTTRSFNSNGVSVCTLAQQTTSNYTLLTGALASTTTTQTTTLLKSM